MSIVSKCFRSSLRPLISAGAFFGVFMLHCQAIAQSLAGGYIYQGEPPIDRDLGGGFVEFLFNPSPRPALVYRPGPESDWNGGRPVRRGVPRDEDHVRLDFDRPRAAVESPRRAEIAPQFLPRMVDYRGPERPGTIVVDTPHHFLFLIEGNGVARRYGIGVGRPGFTWSGIHHVSAMREWPDWTPPKEMRRRQPYLPLAMPGGPNNPLGARALYLGSTLYRIHGSNEPWTIGHNVSSGCIRMRNTDVIDLYGRVRIGAKVIVL
jgi:lipoprotein-anchoring transpeptidase ErfK/SrfK